MTVAVFSTIGTALLVFGVWALLSGAIQFVVAIRRCRSHPLPEPRRLQQFAFVVDELVRRRRAFRAQGAGTVVERSWQLLRLRLVLVERHEDLDALGDHMAAGAGRTLVSLARWAGEQRASRRG
ncbi:hypothetical protein [Streptomyces tendae]|uniref:hypothetical protein n=1 Tax=Streptomyces tendae TaxID=1932 RepID=UPI0036A8CB5A